jgi:hypothetical protein
MNRIIVALVASLLVMPAFAGMQFDAKTWRTLQTTDVRSLNKDMSGRVGQLIEMHCNFRGKDIRHLKPGWYESSVWQIDPDGKKGFSDVRVMVAERDLPAFKTLPTNNSSTGDLTLYGKVLRDSAAKFLFVRLVGRTTVVDPSGRVSVNW